MSVLESVLSPVITKNFEQVSIWSDNKLGITAIISIHSTVMGPSLGGCRVFDYSSIEQAMYDVLRLSEGMTYKNALANLPIGGGKSVIMASSDAMKNRREVFLKFASWVESLGGRYITAEDMGTSVNDIHTISEITKHVSGVNVENGGGDPSPFTARGTFLGIKACAEVKFGSPDLQGKSVLIQGLGSVGIHLAEHLNSEGVNLLFSDVSKDKLDYALIKFPKAKVVEIEKVYSTPCDIFSPCAIGGIINEVSAPILPCSIVAGAANNQLSTQACENILMERGIVYAPDFAINAGGVIMCADEVDKSGFNRERVDQRVSMIGGTVKSILEESNRRALPAGVVAVQKAEQIIAKKNNNI